jgi:hypothetical protein
MDTLLSMQPAAGTTAATAESSTGTSRVYSRRGTFERLRTFDRTHSFLAFDISDESQWTVERTRHILQQLNRDQVVPGHNTLTQLLQLQQFVARQFSPWLQSYIADLIRWVEVLNDYHSVCPPVHDPKQGAQPATVDGKPTDAVFFEFRRPSMRFIYPNGNDSHWVQGADGVPRREPLFRRPSVVFPFPADREHIIPFSNPASPLRPANYGPAASSSSSSLLQPPLVSATSRTALVGRAVYVPAQAVEAAGSNSNSNSRSDMMSAEWERSCTLASVENALTDFARTALFAAERHARVKQTRKDEDNTPYINHPLEVAHILAECGVTNVRVLQAALLHDVVEDTGTSLAEVQQHAGPDVAKWVGECTDDKKLDKIDRKRLQLEHACDASPEAKQIKVADKMSNVRGKRPKGWKDAEWNGYRDWCYAVSRAASGALPALDELARATFHRLDPTLATLSEGALQNRLQAYYRVIEASL